MCPSLLIDKNTNQVGSCRTISTKEGHLAHFIFKRISFFIQSLTQVRLAIGAAGGTKITTAVAQVHKNIIAYLM